VRSAPLLSSVASSTPSATSTLTSRTTPDLTAAPTVHLSVVPGMMCDVSHDSVTARPLVGRADELDQLAALVGLDDLTGGSSTSAVLLAGDAGVGKTRLLAALRDRATASDWRVIVGHCLDFGDSALPYLPFSEAFGRLAGEAPALAASLVEAHPAVARLMPRRRLMSGDGASAAGADHDGDGAARIDRGELFEGVHAALEQLAESAPLLLLVEDAHWADQSTRELLSFLFARRFNARVSIVTSYRSDDLHRRHPLRTTAAEWARLAGVTRLQLRPLDDTDVRALVTLLHPTPLAEREMRDIIARAEGNAFFTEELVAAAEMGSRMLPTDLADLLLVRLDRLDDESRQVVRAASVAGRRVSHGLLAAVVRLDETALELALRVAVESNVLVAVGADGYAFRHALLAEAVYDDLLPGERVRLHGAYAAALASHDVEGTAAELARHARAAHDLTTAIRASIQAGDEAMAVAGPDEAAKHYEVALELLADPDLAAVSDVDPIELTVRASDAAAAAGHVYRAVALVQEQLRALPDDAAPLDRARLLHTLAHASMVTESTIDLLAVTSEALKLVPAEPVTPLRARVVNAHARANADYHRDDDAARWSSEALTMARALGLADVAADAATTLARLEERAGDPQSSQAKLEKAVAEARTAGELASELRGMYNLGALHYEQGHLTEALDAFAETAERARAAGRPWAPYGADARAMVGVVAYVRGDWDRVLRTVDVSDESPPGVAEATLSAIGLTVAAGRGERAALDLAPTLRPWWERDGMIAVIGGAASIDLHGDGGDLPAAIAVHDDVVETLGELWMNPNFQARTRLSALLLGQLSAAASRVSADERVALARRGDELLGVADLIIERRHHRGRRQGPEGQAWYARALAEHARLRWLTGRDAPGEDELVASWQAAVEGFEAFGQVFEVARTQARLAAVLRAVGRTGEAAEAAEAARVIARRLGAEPLLGELRLLAPGGAAAAGRGAASRRDESLTARENEVLALVAQGRSNRDIGQQLYISGKTVSVHVSNILAKLGAGGRTEAVAVARRRGLLEE
jgi:DNA-binding CsgD family transcriptional regulator/tetratricopeptide (TPR) repeat protein